MERMVMAFQHGGVIMILIGIPSMIFIPLLVVQFFKRRTLDITWLLWSLLGLFLALGMLGAGVGLMEAGDAAASAAPEQLTEAAGPGLAKAINTAAYGLLTVMTAAIPLAIATAKVRKYQG
jgi:hypothetical protein